MTLKVSFPKLIFENLRRHLAAVFITALIFFISLLSFFMETQNITQMDGVYSITEKSNAISGETLQYISEELLEQCAPTFASAVLAMFLGAYLAFEFLRYMHSRKETDFYESLPIRRQIRFVSLFFSSLLLYVLLSAIVTVLKIVLIVTSGYGSGAMIQFLLWDFVCMLAAFLVTWFTTALVMILTGNSIIAILGFGAICIYVPLILANLLPSYCERFFDTYVYHQYSNKFYYFSPATLVYKMTNSYFVSRWNITEHWTYLVGTLVFAAVCALIAYLLFLRRPSEAAGRAMAFERANSILRIFIVIPLALYCGLLLESMSVNPSIFWIIFGIILGAFLLHGILEAIFQSDIRALFSKKAQLGLSILFCLGFLCVFWFDLIRYDDYIPDANKIKTIKLESSLFGWCDSDLDIERDWIVGEMIPETIDVLKEIQAADTDTTENSTYYDSLTATYQLDSLTVTYQLKSGREIHRYYTFDLLSVSDRVNHFFTEEDVKDDFCALYHIDRNNIETISVSNGLDNTVLELTEAEKDLFLEIFLKEYTKLDLKALCSSEALYTICVDYLTSKKQSVSEEYYIYPSFTETIEFLNQKGIVPFHETSDLVITNLELYDYNPDGSSKYISDASLLQELKPYMQPCLRGKYQTEDVLYGDIEYKTGDFFDSYYRIMIQRSDLDRILNQS